HLARGGESALGVVGLLERSAEQGHDPVAHVGDQCASRVQDRFGHLVYVEVDGLDHPRSRLSLGEGSKAAQVAEQHRAVALERAAAHPSSTISAMLTHPGAVCSGTPSSTVAVALARTSGPLIGSRPEVGVWCWSCSEAAVGPTITIFPASSDGATRPSYTRE